jgi:hypothetical protein
MRKQRSCEYCKHMRLDVAVCVSRNERNSASRMRMQLRQSRQKRVSESGPYDKICMALSPKAFTRDKGRARAAPLRSLHLGTVLVAEVKWT